MPEQRELFDDPAGGAEEPEPPALMPNIQQRLARWEEVQRVVDQVKGLVSAEEFANLYEYSLHWPRYPEYRLHFWGLWRARLEDRYGRRHQQDGPGAAGSLHGPAELL